MTDAEYEKLKKEKKELIEKLKQVEKQLLCHQKKINKNFTKICHIIYEYCDKYKSSTDNIDLEKLSTIASIKMCKYVETIGDEDYRPDTSYDAYIEYHDGHWLKIHIEKEGESDWVMEFSINMYCPKVGKIYLQILDGGDCRIDTKNFMKCKKCIIGKIIEPIIINDEDNV